MWRDWGHGWQFSEVKLKESLANALLAPVMRTMVGAMMYLSRNELRVEINQYLRYICYG